MSERALQLATVSHIRSSIVCACPNYEPEGWWECDVWAVTKAGYAVEYEVKLTVADFKADAKKTRLRYLPREERTLDNYTKVRKYDLLAQGDRFGPSRFYYVVPESIAEDVEPLLPAWAGLFKVDPKWTWRMRLVKDARRLHNHHARAREVKLAQRRMWFRYWNCLRAMHKQGVEEPKESTP